MIYGDPTSVSTPLTTLTTLKPTDVRMRDFSDPFQSSERFENGVEFSVFHKLLLNS